MVFQRNDHRAPDEKRPLRIFPNYVKTAAGSCLIETGGTRVICTCSVQDGAPPFLRGKDQGWLTAEYAMLPASTGQRKTRDGVKKDGRGVEIGRLIGRALRQAVDLKRLGDRTLTIDCDVLEADGGTRTASITGGFVALCLAIDKLIREGRLYESPVRGAVAAISCGIVGDTPCLDLNYLEDSRANVDMNVIMDGEDRLIEVQGTGEGRSFSKDELDSLLALAQRGVRELICAQKEALKDAALLIGVLPELVLATNNAHKAKELKTMLEGKYRVLTLKEAGIEADVDETGATFEENAVLKAEAVRDLCHRLTLADDSGLSVDALSGAPGVLSARYAGEHGNDRKNNDLLIENMQDVPDEKRTAHFVSALALASPLWKTRTYVGECPGTILREARGAGGFGYDPYFLYENGQTFAEMDADTKNKVSHRARAMAKLKEDMEKE